VLSDLARQALTGGVAPASSSDAEAF